MVGERGTTALVHPRINPLYTNMPEEKKRWVSCQSPPVDHQPLDFSAIDHRTADDHALAKITECLWRMRLLVVATRGTRASETA